MFPLPKMLAEHLDRRVLRQVELAFGRRLVVALDAVFLDERNDAFAEGVLSRGRAGGKQEQWCETDGEFLMLVWRHLGVVISWGEGVKGTRLWPAAVTI